MAQPTESKAALKDHKKKSRKRKSKARTLAPLSDPDSSDDGAKAVKAQRGGGEEEDWEGDVEMKDAARSSRALPTTENGPKEGRLSVEGGEEIEVGGDEISSTKKDKAKKTKKQKRHSNTHSDPNDTIKKPPNQSPSPPSPSRSPSPTPLPQQQAQKEADTDAPITSPSLHLRLLTQTFGTDLDKIRQSKDFRAETSVPMLVRVLELAGEAGFSAEERAALVRAAEEDRRLERERADGYGNEHGEGEAGERAVTEGS